MTYVLPVPRHRRLTPARCEVLARRLDRIVNDFEQHEITVPQLSRLRREGHLLRRIASERAFPIDETARRSVANAARDAYEFEAIRKLVGESKMVRIAKDIAIHAALKGTPERSEGTSSTPYEFQSELWIGSVFHAAGATLRVPEMPTTKSPDFVIENISASAYGLEVKRPHRAAAIPNLLAKAVRQLREYGVIGGVALDVSDCLSQAMLQQHRADRSEPPYAITAADFRQVYRGAGDLLIDSRRRKMLPAINVIFFLIVYATGWRWFDKCSTGPEFFSASQFGTFVTTKGNLAYWHADAIRRAYERGCKKIGLFVTQETYEQHC